MSTLNLKNNEPIGFFDSGVGGLSVYARFKEVLPNENTLYYGDLKNLPYGNKSKSELIGFARKILDFYSAKDVKAVIIACNTSSAQAYDTIKNEYDFKIYPIIQSCAKVVASSAKSCIGVFATSATVSSGVYSREIKKYRPNILVHEISCPNWVSIVEGNFVGDKDFEIKSHAEEMLKFSPEKIILGCTHYPYLKQELLKYIPQDIFIDPAKIFADFVRNDLSDNQLLNLQHRKGTEEFFVSASPEKFIQNAKIFYSINSLPQVV